MKTMLIIHFDDGQAKQIFCENRNCRRNEIDHVHSFGEAVEKIGWAFYRVPKNQIDGNLNKLSKINPQLLSGGTLMEAYCPDCKEPEDAK